MRTVRVSFVVLFLLQLTCLAVALRMHRPVDEVAFISVVVGCVATLMVLSLGTSERRK
jgi:hypothetical protein